MTTPSIRDFTQHAQDLFREHRFTKDGLLGPPGEIITIQRAIQMAAIRLGCSQIEAILNGVNPGWHRLAEYYLNYVSSQEFRELLREMLPTEMAEWEDLEKRRLAGDEALSLEYVFHLVKQYFYAHSGSDSDEITGVVDSVYHTAAALFLTNQSQLMQWLQTEAGPFVTERPSSTPMQLGEVVEWFLRELPGRFWLDYREDMIKMLDVEARNRRSATVSGGFLG